MRTYVYVDGFNLYYGCCKGRPFKWLNLLEVCRKLLRPENDIQKIWYFSAEVKSRPDDPDKLNRQRLFLRALRSIPILEIELGMFLESGKMMPQADPAALPRFVKVLKTEEKGSDVNLATRLLLDAFDNHYDCAVLVTNDSDLTGPIKAVRQRFGKKVGILNPQKRPSHALSQCVDFYKPIREGVLRNSLFPNELKDADGLFRKPAGW